MHIQELAISNDLAALTQVRDLVATAIRGGDFPDIMINRLQIAVDEAVTNIIEHGYDDRGPGRGRIILRTETTTDEFRITIIDNGRCFDPTLSSEVDIKRHVAAGHDGGLGVFLIRRIMDVVDYRYESGRENRLILVKKR